MYNGYFQRGEESGCDSDQHLHLPPRLRMRGTISVLPTCTSMVCTGINLEVVIVVVVVVVVVFVVHVP